MTQRQRNNYIAGINYYVPSMQHGGDLGQLLRQRANYGALVVASATALLSAQSIAAAVDTKVFAVSADAVAALMGPYGRTIQIVASGAAVSAWEVRGRDYLGQPMKETGILNGAVIVQGVKAFKYVDRVILGITAATTINLGTGAKFGLPYVTTAIEREFADNVVAAAGALVAPVFTDPQTATTGDPRGLVTPTTTPNGVKIIEMDLEFTNVVNANNRGGLHGIQHFNT